MNFTDAVMTVLSLLVTAVPFWLFRYLLSLERRPTIPIAGFTLTVLALNSVAGFFLFPSTSTVPGAVLRILCLLGNFLVWSYLFINYPPELDEKEHDKKIRL